MTDATKTLTVKEFTMWLQGVEEMQDESWIPSATQWKRIREKINLIKDTPPPRAAAQTQPDNTRPVSFAQPVFAQSGMTANPAADLAGRPFMPEQPGQAAKTPSIDTSNGTYTSSFA